MTVYIVIRTHFINRRARVCTRIGAGKACDASRSGSTRKERNAVQRRFWCKPFGKVVWTAHCSVAPLAQGTTLCVATRLALHPSRPPSRALLFMK
jgi:hypothetical protein